MASDQFRDRLTEMLQQATTVAEASSDVIELGRFLLHERERLHAAATTISKLEERERELLLAEAQRAYLRRPEELACARSAGDLVRAWTQLLLEAVDRIEQDRRDAELYRAAEDAPGAPEA